jgi:hypothetical protein
MPSWRSASFRVRSGFCRALIALVVGGMFLAPIRPAQADKVYEGLYVPCSKRFVSAQGVQFRMAEHPYPFRAATVLAHVVVLGRRPVGGLGVPPGYEQQKIVEGIFVRHGAIAVVCGLVDDHGPDQGLEGVTLIFPRKPDLDGEAPW